MSIRDERRQEDRDTRDVAVRAEANIESHINDCVAVRVRVENRLTSLGDDIKTLASKTDRNTWILGCIIGGMILAREALELYLTYRK